MNALTSFIVIAIGRGRFHCGRMAHRPLPDRRAAGEDGSLLALGRSPEQAKRYRVFGWILVVLLYLLAVFCLLQGCNALRIVHHWQEWQASFGNVLNAQAQIALYSEFWIAMAIVLCCIGYWAQRHLRQRA